MKRCEFTSRFFTGGAGSSGVVAGGLGSILLALLCFCVQLNRLLMRSGSVLEQGVLWLPRCSALLDDDGALVGTGIPVGPGVMVGGERDLLCANAFAIERPTLGKSGLLIEAGVFC